MEGLSARAQATRYESDDVLEHICPACIFWHFLYAQLVGETTAGSMWDRVHFVSVADLRENGGKRAKPETHTLSFSLPLAYLLPTHTRIVTLCRSSKVRVFALRARQHTTLSCQCYYRNCCSNIRPKMRMVRIISVNINLAANNLLPAGSIWVISQITFCASSQSKSR